MKVRMPVHAIAAAHISPMRPELAWWPQAACRGMDMDVFFPESPYPDWKPATEACTRCPVLDECRAWNDEREGSLGVDSIHGFFGGESPRARVARRRAVAV